MVILIGATSTQRLWKLTENDVVNISFHAMKCSIRKEIKIKSGANDQYHMSWGKKAKQFMIMY